MRFVWKVLPPQKNEKEPLYGAVSAETEKETAEKQKKNLDLYLKGLRETKDEERVRFIEQARAWENSNDLASFRQAGVTMEKDEKDPLLRHRLLSSAYLEEIKGRDKLTFKVNFRGNGMAEYKIGAGDLFPPSVSVISVNGQRAVRAINPGTERIGYYDEKEFLEGRYVYVPVFSGDTVEILSTRGAGEYIVQRRQLQERITLYQGRGATALEDAEISPQERRDAGKAGVRAQTRQQLGGVIPDQTEQYAQSRDPAEVLAQRRRMVEIATKYAGTRYFQENYFNAGRQYSSTVEKGRLGCALVVTHIMKEAGYLNNLNGLILGVAMTEVEMQKRGWTKTNGPIEAGDVLVWAPMQAPSGVKARHGHIGIAVSPTQAVHNSNNYITDPATGKRKLAFKGPVLETIKRQPVAVWKPPGAMPGTRVPGAAVASRQPETTRRAIDAGASTAVNRSTRKIGQVAQDHQANAEKLKINPERTRMINAFLNAFERNRARYERVAQATGVPAILIAAIHNLEGGMSFKRYLHNGQLLGQVTTIEPKGILFGPGQWEEAAIHALGGNVTDQRGNPSLKGVQQIRSMLGITKDTTDMGKLWAMAEAYNGLGYRGKPTPSPYIYAGTNMYEKGLFVADGKYDPNARHRGVGIAAMLEAGKERGVWGGGAAVPGTGVT